MTPKRPSTERELRQDLMHLTLGYWRSQTLFAAVRLGVFDALGEGAAEAGEIGSRCGANEAYTERLLNACVALGLLQRQGERYAPSRLAELFLVPGAPQYMGHWVRFMSDYYLLWGRLEDVVAEGRPVEDGLAQLSAGSEYTRDLILAMHEYAVGPGREAISRLELGDRKRLLDVGGGAGSYAILLAERHPQLHAEVLDLAPVVAIAQEVIAAARLGDRITTRAGNYLTDDWGEGRDVVLLSNMLHQESPDTCLKLLRKARDVLVPGGLLVIQLSLLNEAKDGPLWPILQSLQLALSYPGGRTYSGSEIAGLAREAGFNAPEIQRASLVSSESLVLATKNGRSG